MLHYMFTIVSGASVGLGISIFFYNKRNDILRGMICGSFIANGIYLYKFTSRINN